MKTTAQHKTARAEQYRADSELALSGEAASRYLPQHKTARAEQIYSKSRADSALALPAEAAFGYPCMETTSRGDMKSPVDFQR